MVHEVLRSPGQPLDAATRAIFEPRFGHDFSQVRVHTGTQATESARQVSAEAYTVGRNLVFGTGHYQPHTDRGQRLIAHELTHVLQQRSAALPPLGQLVVSPPTSPSEKEAEAAARSVEGGRAWVPLTDWPAMVARQPAGDPADAGVPDRTTQLECVKGLGGCANTRPGGIPSAEEIAGYNAQCRQRTGYPGPDVVPTTEECQGAGATPAPGGPAASPTVPGSKCQIDIRATHIGGILSNLPIWHLFIVHRNAAGTDYFFRGGPGGKCPGVTGTYGSIISTTGPYVPGTVDWDPGAPSETVLTGPSACGKDTCFASELSRIDKTCTPYAPTGPNSNTVAKTLLSNCGLPLKKPVAVAPGWGDPTL